MMLVEIDFQYCLAGSLLAESGHSKVDPSLQRWLAHPFHACRGYSDVDYWLLVRGGALGRGDSIQSKRA